MSRHAVLLFSYCQVPEQLELCRGAVASITCQDIGDMDIMLIDNGSTLPGVYEHFRWVSNNTAHRVHYFRHRENLSPSVLVNRALYYLFGLGHEKILCVSDDTYLPPNFYRLLEDWPKGMVCASEMREANHPCLANGFNDEVRAVSLNTPMAVGLCRRWFYEALVDRYGYFLDEGYRHYASDCDLALRMAACGLWGVQLNVPYYHYGSASWRMLPPEEGKKLTDRADADRAYFERKWGFKVDALEYGQSAADLNFRGKSLLETPVSQKALAASGGKQ